MPPGRPAKLPDTIAALRSIVECSSEATLPAAGILARRLRVSSRTLLKAADVLRKEGLLEFTSGSQMRISRFLDEKEVESTPPCSTERVYNRIRRLIETGVHRSGEPIPKVYTFTSRYGVSDKTVTAALRRLQKDKLIHKHGRRYFVGPYSSPSRVETLWAPPVVLLVQEHIYSWRHLASSTRTARFATAVNEGLESRGVRIEPVLTSSRAAGLVAPAAIGLEQAREIIRNHRERYLGALIAGKSSEVDDLKKWIGMLSEHGRIVWFDRMDERKYQRIGSKSKEIFRCHFSEQAALRCGLEYLSAMNHDRVAYVNPMAEESGWKNRRGDLLRSMAGNSAGITVEISPTSAYLGRHGSAELCRNGIAHLYNRRAPITKVFAYFLDQFHLYEPIMAQFGISPQSAQTVDRVYSLMKFIALGGTEDTDGIGPEVGEVDRKRKIRGLATWPRPVRRYVHDMAITMHLLYTIIDPRVTALIATNDSEAVYILRWLRLAGYRVPEDYSLLSFDNKPDIQPYPIDSVDFGFGSLGYFAVHALLGDIPVGRDRFGNVPPVPRVVQRGSVKLRV